MARLSMDERIALHEAIFAATDEEEKERLMMRIPLAPKLAMIAKEMYGKKALLADGYDLSEANEEFGDGWLDK